MVRSAWAWIRSITSSRRSGVNRCANRFCARRYGLDGLEVPDRRRRTTSPRSASYTREQPALGGGPCQPHCLVRARAPAERAGHQHVQVARPAERHRLLDLGLEVAQVGDRGGRHVGDLVGHRDPRGVLALPELVARRRPHGLRRRRPGRSGGRAGALDAGVHVRLVVVADVEHVVVALEHARQARRSRCRPCRRLRPGPRPGCRPCPAPAAPRRPPSRPLAALPNSECSQGTCQDDSGYGEENTSRQPVALTVTSRPSVARTAASRTKRAPSASPQPWQARWPEVMAFGRSSSDCTVRSSWASRRLPTAKLPTW